MNLASWICETQEARLVTGRVMQEDKDGFRVLAGDGIRQAVPAAGCLLLPARNDTVLLALLENGQAVIISVLFRQETAAATLRLPQESHVECAGALNLRARNSLALQAPHELRLEARDLHVTAGKTAAQMLDVAAQMDVANFCCRELTSLGRSSVSAFGSVSRCCGESRKLVEGSDETHCANASLTATEQVAVMSRDSVHLAEETARTDARLIQMG